MVTRAVQIGFVGDDDFFFAKLDVLKYEAADRIFKVGITEAENTPVHFDVGQLNLILVHWNVNVVRAIPPARLLKLIRYYVRDGFRVAVVISEDDLNPSVARELLQVGACSFIYREADITEIDQWMGQMLLLPLRGPWGRHVVFP